MKLHDKAGRDLDSHISVLSCLDFNFKKHNCKMTALTRQRVCVPDRKEEEEEGLKNKPTKFPQVISGYTSLARTVSRGQP